LTTVALHEYGPLDLSLASFFIKLGPGMASKKNSDPQLLRNQHNFFESEKDSHAFLRSGADASRYPSSIRGDQSVKLYFTLSIEVSAIGSRHWLCKAVTSVKYNHLVANLLSFHTLVTMTKALQQMIEEGYTFDVEALSTLSPYRPSISIALGIM
jgi:hypothetical protein